MLALAHRNHEAEGRAFDQDEGADLYHEEVYGAAYGWAPRQVWAPTTRSDLTWAWRYPSPEVPRIAHRFDPPAGVPRGPAQAAVSRAAARLAWRGLVEALHAASGTWGGISLTPAGLAAAAAAVRPPRQDDDVHEHGQPPAVVAPNEGGSASQGQRDVRDVRDATTTPGALGGRAGGHASPGRAGGGEGEATGALTVPTITVVTAPPPVAPVPPRAPPLTLAEQMAAEAARVAEQAGGGGWRR
jgi:hypothetical protein